jgi:hypothetical protein
MIYIIIFIVFILGWQIQNIMKYFRYEHRGWKLHKKGNNRIIYFQKVHQVWEQIEIEARINIGTFEPIFKNEIEWKNYPTWAQDRDAIISRIIEMYPLKDDSIYIDD